MMHARSCVDRSYSICVCDSVCLCVGAPKSNGLSPSGEAKSVLVMYPNVCPTSTLWQFDIAIENGPFIVDLPMVKKSDSPELC